MNAKLLNNWAGGFSDGWMLAGFAIIVFVLLPLKVGFEPRWLYAIVLTVSWLGVPLVLAVRGLSRGNLAGRVCAVVALVIFIYFVRWWVMPAFVP